MDHFASSNLMPSPSSKIGADLFRVRFSQSLSIKLFTFSYSGSQKISVIDFNSAWPY